MGDHEDAPQSSWSKRRDLKAQMYATSSSGVKLFRGRDGGDGDDKSMTCQKCLQKGHWTYE
jgi:hypothetical protein